MKEKNFFNRWEFSNKIFFSLFMTGLLVEFSQVGAGFIDGLLVSRFLGSEAMAAEGIAHPIYSIIGIISGLFAIGMQVNCAKEIGRGNIDKFCRIVSSTVYVGSIVSIIITIFIIAFSKQFVALLGAKGNANNLIEPASKYLIGISIGIPAMIITEIFVPAFQLDSGRKIIQTGALINAVSDIILDIIAIKIGLGLFGVGLATAISYYIYLIWQCTFFLKKERIFHFVGKTNISFIEFLKMLLSGIEKAVRRLANTLRFVILNTIIVTYGGVTALTAISVFNNLSNLIGIIAAGIASAIGLMIGVYYGEINLDGIKETKKEEYRIICCIGGCFAFLIFIFAGQIARFYITTDGEAYNMTTFAIRILALQIPLQAIIESRIKYLQAIDKKYNVNVLTIFTRLIFVVLIVWIMGLLYGIYGVFISFIISDILTLLAIYIYYVVKCKKIIVTIKDILNLPKCFYLNKESKILFDIRSIEDVVFASEEIMLFCKKHKVKSKIAYFVSLAFEELGVNIVKHGFSKNSSINPMVDVYVVITNENLVFRLRDDCPLYDITKRISDINKVESDITHNIGSRIVSKIASEITYLNVFGTNSLIIKFEL